MDDASLSEMKLKDTAFHDNGMRGINFFETSLSGVNLTTDNIEGIGVSQSFSELRGAVISPEQACIIARMLGIKIE